uniref:HTH CENPB-type domain-containing protein n=1 Tax=Pygocentrus nattereri TaxID=42514 RepID=A0AAR2J5P4_PYGNA
MTRTLFHRSWMKDERQLPDLLCQLIDTCKANCAVLDSRLRMAVASPGIKSHKTGLGCQQVLELKRMLSWEYGQSRRLPTPQLIRAEKMPSKRKSYSADYKLQVVKYAAENGNRAAERKFGVTEKLVRDWRKAEVSLTAMKKTKKANRGLKARWPQLEERVRTWVLEQRLRLHAQVVAKEMNINDFAGGPSWCYRFMQRNRLSIRARTTMSQKLPADFQAKVDSFREFVEKHVTEHNMTPDHIINMDEVPLTFDIPMGRSVAEKGLKSVNIVTTGNEKSHFTVVLACCGDGSKLPPMVIFKRKTMPKIQSPSVAVAVNEKGWMDQEMMNLWLTKSLLVMDSMRAHITPQFKNKLKVFNTIPAIIPGGLTKILQPLDISVNRSFKAVLRHLWEQWMLDGEHSFTATGRMRHATFSEVIEWISKAWASVKTESILLGFRKAGIIANVTDDESDKSDEEEEAALRPPPELAELFISDTEDEEFNGFDDLE